MKQKFFAVELLSFVYIGLTTLIILIFNFRFSNELPHLLIRLIYIFIIFILAYLSPKFKLVEYLRIFIPLAFLGFFYSETDYFNNLWFENLDPYFANLEQKLFNCQPALVFQVVYSAGWFREIMYFGYLSYYILIFLVCFELTKSSAEMGKKAIFIVVAGFYLFYLFYSFFPVAGPQYYYGRPEYSTEGFHAFSKLMIFIQDVAERPTAAFPSSHVAMACILLILASWKSTRFALLLLPFVILLFFSTIYIQAHYLIDVISGIIISPIIYFSSKLLSILFENKGI